MVSGMLAPAYGDTITLLDGDGKPTENVAIVSEVHIVGIGYFEVEDNTGEHFNVERYPEMDTDLTKGWIEVLVDDEE